MKFVDYSAYQKLKKLAKTPPDLTQHVVFNTNRIVNMSLSACSWKLLYSTERVNEDIKNYLCQLALEANVYEKMYNMQNMKVMNFVNGVKSEERAVGHTAIRSLNSINDFSSEAIINVSKLYRNELEKLKIFLSKLNQISTIVVVGIGGSYLGINAIYNAYKVHSKNNRRLMFISSVDSDDALSLLKEIDMKSTIVAVISKSGTTIEIKSQQELFRKKFEAKGFNSKKHFVAITSPGSEIDNRSNYCEVFYVWDFIGGRYSLSSMVGALPLAFVFGIDMWMSFLDGMHDMDVHALTEKDPTKNLPLFGALLGIWNRNFLNYSSYAVIPYSQCMHQYSLHLQQLFMESNGKSTLQNDSSLITWSTSPIVFGTVGTQCQHSYFQAVHQGTEIIPIEFIGFRESQLECDDIIDGTTNQKKLTVNMFAQSLALARGKYNANNNKYFSGNRPSHILISDKLDAYSIGNLLAYHEHYAVYQGWIWGINSFDQEGVELGKALANDMLNICNGKIISSDEIIATLLHEL